MSNTLYALINPVAKFVLRSPFHGLMSRNTMLLEFTGRKSGKTYVMPVSYRAADGGIHCFTDRSNLWWRNLEHGGEVWLTLRGEKRLGKPRVHADGGSDVQQALREFLIATPRDASHAGVAFDSSGQPMAADIEEASTRLVLLAIDLVDA